MSAPKRTKAQREDDLLVIGRMYVQGYSQREIAAYLAGCRPYQLSRVTITHDIAELLARWRAEAVRDISELKAAELARLNQLERASWAEWERSRQPAVKRVKGKRTGGKDGDVDHEATTRENQCGDPRYLERVTACIDKRCKLLGLDAPTKIAPTDPSGQNPYAGATDAELLELAQKVLSGATS